MIRDYRLSILPFSSWNSNTVIWLLFAFAILIRVWGTWYGLPFSSHKDEYHEVMRALALGAGDFNFNRTSKGGFYFLLFFEYGLYFVYLKLTGIVANAQEFAQAIIKDPTALYLLGRMTAALVGSATVAAAYHVTRFAFSGTAAVLAGMFLGVNTLHIDLSRIIGVDVPMTMLATLAIYFGIRIAAKGQRKDYLWAALFGSLATTTKLTGILVLPPLLIAHGYAVANSGRGIRGWFAARELWLALAVFLLVLVVTNPGVFGQTGYLSLFVDSSADFPDGEDVQELAEFPGEERPGLYIYYLAVLQDSMGWSLFLLSLVGVVHALVKRTSGDVILLSYAVLNYVVLSSTTSELYYPRYALPIIVVLGILAARALTDLTRLMFKRGAVLATGLVATLCVTVPLWQDVATAYALTQTDTRILALRWFQENIPAGSRVLIEGGKIGPDRGSVPLPESRSSLELQLDYWKTAEPRQARLLRFMLAAHQGGGYELVFLEMDSADTLDEYVAQRVEYFVIRPTRFTTSRRAKAGTIRLVKDLHSDPRIQLVKRFEGETRTQLGPTIEIYRSVVHPSMQLQGTP